MYIFSEIMAFIEEVVTQVFGTSASPGFTWGRSGNSPSGTWLQNDSVPSNITGRNIFLNNAKIKKIFVANQDASILKLGVYWHEGDGINLTFISDITTTAVRTSEFAVDLSVPKDKQVAIKIADDSPNAAKNIVAGVLIAGNLV